MKCSMCGDDIDCLGGIVVSVSIGNLYEDPINPGEYMIERTCRTNGSPSTTHYCLSCAASIMPLHMIGEDGTSDEM